MLSGIFQTPKPLGAIESIVTAATSSAAAVFLIWTSIILCCHRNKWRILDTLIFLLIIQSVVKQLIGILYACLTLIQPIESSWCPTLSWLLTSSHTLEAGTLTTLALSILLKRRLPESKYKQILSTSHILYHTFCLLLLSSCVGVAAILAQTENNVCAPLKNRRYLVFYVALHLALIMLAFIALILSCCRPKRFSNTSTIAKNLLLNSSSDISSAISEVSVLSSAKSKPPFDDTVQRYAPTEAEKFFKLSRVNGSVNGRNTKTAPCKRGEFIPIPEVNSLHFQFNADHMGFREDKRHIFGFPAHRLPALDSMENSKDVSTSTIAALLVMCYLVNHIPVLISSVLVTIAPEYMPPHWPQNTFPLWAALAEGCLLPVVLFMFDDQFAPHVASLYRGAPNSDKDIYGNFRTFDGTVLDTTSGSEASNVARFPLTNGSLFANTYGLPILQTRKKARGIVPKKVNNSWNVMPVLPQKTPYNGHHVWHENNTLQRTPYCFRSNRNGDTKNSAYFHGRNINTNLNKTLLEDKMVFSNILSNNSCTWNDGKELHKPIFLMNCDDQEDEEPIYATLSACSAYSATTSANDDFEYFRHFDNTSHNFSKQLHEEHENAKNSEVINSTSNDSVRRYNTGHRHYTRGTDLCRTACLHGMPWYYHPNSPITRTNLRYSMQHKNRYENISISPNSKNSSTPVLSVRSLAKALDNATYSYLDTGDICEHPKRVHCSVPDLKKVIVTEFL